MHRRTFLASAAAGFAAAPFAIRTANTPAYAQGSLQLTDDIRDRLVALPALRDPIDPAKYFDGTPILFSFWASWCPPCTAEFNEIKEFIAKHGPDKVRIVAVNWIENSFSSAGPDDLRRYAKRFIDPSIAVVTGNADTGTDFGGVRFIPAVFLFDGDGNETLRLEAAGGHGTSFMRATDLERALNLAA